VESFYLSLDVKLYLLIWVTENFLKFIFKKYFSGHFGLWPVRISWFFVVFPSVVMNYLGQGAFLIHHPDSIENPYILF